MRLTEEQKARFLQRSFKAVDGLWCLKVEEVYGFEKALEIDKLVWEVFPKIQAREMKAILCASNDAQSLFDCLTTMLELEGYTHSVEKKAGGFEITITGCPWHDIMVKSGRAQLSGQVGDVICQTEFSAWVKEFGSEVQFAFSSPRRLCHGTADCVLCFKK